MLFVLIILLSFFTCNVKLFLILQLFSRLNAFVDQIKCFFFMLKSLTATMFNKYLIVSSSRNLHFFYRFEALKNWNNTRNMKHLFYSQWTGPKNIHFPNTSIFFSFQNVDCVPNRHEKLTLVD